MRPLCRTDAPRGPLLAQAFMSVVAGTMLVLAAWWRSASRRKPRTRSWLPLSTPPRRRLSARPWKVATTSWNRGGATLRLHDSRSPGATDRPAHPPDIRDEHPEMLARLQRGERIAHYETQHMAKDGTRYDVALTIAPIRMARASSAAHPRARGISPRGRRPRPSWSAAVTKPCCWLRSPKA